jgi:phenylalanyl-tRNA synthetase beta chain
MAGLEVESCERLGAGLEQVVVGEIMVCERHPNADKLSVCHVNTGGDALQIVCGAPNARAGLKAPVALVGARLPNGMEIKRAELRGVESQGMLCSARELALGDDQSGLWELPADAPVGTQLASFLALPDATIELKLTPNRPDCLGLRGLGREVATLFQVPFAGVPVSDAKAISAARRDVTLGAPTDCPRYLGRVIEASTPPRRPRSGWSSACAAPACARSAPWSTAPTT